jgi:hypothetical protein
MIDKKKEFISRKKNLTGSLMILLLKNFEDLALNKQSNMIDQP